MTVSDGGFAESQHIDLSALPGVCIETLEIIQAVDEKPLTRVTPTSANQESFVPQT
jgi:hypothetical protein